MTNTQHQPLPRNFYLRPTLTVAQELLGKILVHEHPGGRISGRIVETEAYVGQDDPASHAFRGKTPRNALMFGEAGYAYIYFIYGMYFCLNAVTEAQGFPAAVLIRAIEPLEGETQMGIHRGGVPRRQLGNGPGKLCQAFGLGREHNGSDLCRPPLYIAEGAPPPAETLVCSTRIGIRRGVEHPWRFYIAGNLFVSHPNHA